MIAFAVLVISSGCAVFGQALAPPYVESNEAFTETRIYLAKLLTIKEPVIIPRLKEADDRQHFSFAVLTGLIGGMVKAAQNSTDWIPLDVLDSYLPVIWENYETVSRRGMYILSEVSQKIALMVDLIENVCGDSSVADCNIKIDNIVKGSPHIYGLAADLLLAVGKVSQMIRDNRSNIEAIIKFNQEIPYLLNNAESEHFKDIILLVLEAYKKLDAIQFRRFLNIHL